MISSSQSPLEDRKQVEDDVEENRNLATSYVQMNESIQCRGCFLETRPHGPLTTNQIIDATVLHVLLGWTGALHFYLGRNQWGILYFCTFGLLGVGYLYDFFRLSFLFAEYNKRQLHHPNSIPVKPYEIGEAYVLWLSFGWIGGHHFYLGNISRAILYFFTFGGLGLLFLIDLFLIPQLVRESNARIQSTCTNFQNHQNSCRYCQQINGAPISATATNAHPQREALPIEGAFGAASATTTGPVHQVGVDDALIIKSTTIYTPRNQSYTTDAHATAITSQGAINVPYAYTVNNSNQ